MAASFQALVEQLAPQAEPRPEGTSGSRPAAPAFGALAELLTPAAPRPVPAAPAFGALAELLTPAAPRPAPAGAKPIVLIACSDTKIDTKGRRVPAADLYSSTLFRKSLAYARALTTEDNIRILSGLYGVIPTSQRIATYNYPITKLRQRELEQWGAQARTTLVSDFGKQPRDVIILAGEDYVDALGGLPWTRVLPFGAKRGERMHIGHRLQWLNEQLRALGKEPEPAPKKPAPLKPGRVRMSTQGRPWREVEALAWDGDLFVHEDLADDDLFIITHAPTGRMVDRQFTDERSAIIFAADLNDPAVRPLFDKVVGAIEKKQKEAAQGYLRQLDDLLKQREPLRAARYERVYGRPPPADAVAPASEKAPPSEQLSVRAPAPPPFAALADLLGAPSPAPVPAPSPTPVPPSGERRSTKPASSVAAWSYLGTVGGHMVWPDVGTRVRWNEDTQERRGKVVRHGTREFEGTITRVEVDEMNPHDTDVWGQPDDGGAERRLGIGGIRIPTADLPAFRERAEHWFEKRMKALYGEWPPASPPAPPAAQTEKRRIAQFLIQRASTFASVWPKDGQVVSVTNAKIAETLRREGVAIERAPEVPGQTALEARVAAVGRLRNLAAKTKGKAGEALFVAANDIQGGLHLRLADEEPASSAPDPRVRVAAMTKPRPAPEVAKAPSFADLAASLEAVAPAERVPAAAPVSIASQRERENIVAYLKREAAAAERGRAKLAAQRLRTIANEVAGMTMPATELRAAVIQRLITFALVKTAAELGENKHYTKGEIGAIQAAEGRRPGGPPALKVQADGSLRERIVNEVRGESHSVEVLAGLLGADLTAVREQMTRLLTAGAVRVVDKTHDGPPEYIAVPRGADTEARAAAPTLASELEAERLALPALRSTARELRWRVLQVILTHGRSEAEIAELLQVDPGLVRAVLGQLHPGQYVKRTRDLTGRVEYRADLQAVMRKREARARDLQASTPRPLTLPSVSGGELLIGAAPEAPEAWRVTEINAQGQPVFHTRPLAWADAVAAAVARDGDPRCASDRPPAPAAAERAETADDAAVPDEVWAPPFWRTVPGGPERRARVLEEAAQLLAATDAAYREATSEVERAQGAGEEEAADILETDALARGQDVEGAIAIDVALRGAAPVADDVAALARFADRKGQGQLAAYLRDAATASGGARRSPSSPPSPPTAEAPLPTPPTEEPTVEPTEDDTDEEDTDEGRETSPSVRAPSERPAGPIVVVTLDDGTEVFGMDMGHGVPPLGHFYVTQSAAEARAQTLGEGWDVIKRGRRWLVRRLAGAGTMPGVAGAAARRGQSIDLGDSVITTTLHPWEEKAAEGASPPIAARPAKPLTFAQTRKVLLTGLKERGWIVKADLKIPHASKDRDRLWFKTQAVYLATGMGKDIGDAHSISSDMREYATVEDLLRDVERHRQATPQETEPSRDEWSYQRRAKVARYLESVAKLVGDPSASKLLGDIAEEARGLEGPSPEYAKTIAERLRAAAIGEGAETFSILRRAAWGLDHGSRGPTSAELWAETREGTPEEEFEARRAEAARIEAELDRLRARFPSKRRNAVREMVRDAIRKVRESCISPAEVWPQSADSGVKCDEARDELRAALAARARSLSQDQGDIFTGFQAPRDVAAAAAVVKDIEALSRRLETPEAESFKVGDEVVGAEGEPGGTVIAVRANGNVVVEHADGTSTPWTHSGWWRPAPAPATGSQPRETSEPVEVTAARRRAQDEAAEFVASAQQALDDAEHFGANPVAVAGRRREKDAADAIQFAVHTPPEELDAADMESLARFAERGGKRFLASFLRDVPPWRTPTAREDQAHREKILAYLAGHRAGAILHAITRDVVGAGASPEAHEHVVELLRQMTEEGVLDMRVEDRERWYTLRSPVPSAMLEALTRLLGDEAAAREAEATIEHAAQDQWWNNLIKTRRVYGAALRLMHDDEALADRVLDVARQFQSQVLEEHPQSFVSRTAGAPPILASTLGRVASPAAGPTETARVEGGEAVANRIRDPRVPLPRGGGDPPVAP